MSKGFLHERTHKEFLFSRCKRSVANHPAQIGATDSECHKQICQEFAHGSDSVSASLQISLCSFCLRTSPCILRQPRQTRMFLDCCVCKAFLMMRVTHDTRDLLWQSRYELCPNAATRVGQRFEFGHDGLGRLGCFRCFGRFACARLFGFTAAKNSFY